MLLYCCESADLPAGGDALLMLRENASVWPPSWRRRKTEIDRSFMIWSGVFCGPSIGASVAERSQSSPRQSEVDRSDVVGHHGRSRHDPKISHFFATWKCTNHNTQHNITMLIEPRRTVAAAHRTTATIVPHPPAVRRRNISQQAMHCMVKTGQLLYYD